MYFQSDVASFFYDLFQLFAHFFIAEMPADTDLFLQLIHTFFKFVDILCSDPAKHDYIFFPIDRFLEFLPKPYVTEIVIQKYLIRHVIF